MPVRSHRAAAPVEGLPEDVRFLDCRGCTDFKCLPKFVHAKPYDPKILNGLEDREARSRTWVERHKMTWKSCNFMAIKCVAPHLHVHACDAGKKTVAGKDKDDPNVSYICPKCRRGESADGPLCDNYSRSGFADKLNLLFMWADGKTAQEATAANLSLDTTTKHYHHYEQMIASWMINHTVIATMANRGVLNLDQYLKLKPTEPRELHETGTRGEAGPILGIDHCQVDETHFCVSKDHRGRPNEDGTYCLQTLVLIDSDGRTVDFACAPLHDKSYESLRPLIVNNIPAVLGIVLITDGWMGYAKFSTQDTYTHFVVNHSAKKSAFVCIRSGASTNNVESFHRALKRSISDRGYLNTISHSRHYRILSHGALELGKLSTFRYQGDARRFTFGAVAEFAGLGRTLWMCEQDQRADLVAKQQRQLARTLTIPPPGSFAPATPFTSISMQGDAMVNPWFFPPAELAAAVAAPTQRLSQMAPAVLAPPSHTQIVTQTGSPTRCRRGQANVTSPTVNSPTGTLVMTQSPRRARTGSLIHGDPDDNWRSAMLDEVRRMNNRIATPDEIRAICRAEFATLFGQATTDRQLAFNVDDGSEDDEAPPATQVATPPITQMATQPAIITPVMLRNLTNALEGRGGGRGPGRPSGRDVSPPCP